MPPRPRPCLRISGCSLHQAQLNKLDALIEKAGIAAGDHVLEVGCGWGSFAIRAAQRTGCRWAGGRAAGRVWAWVPTGVGGWLGG